MPSAVTVYLRATAPLFFNETWPLEDIFLDTLRRAQPDLPPTARPDSHLEPYTLSPVRHASPARSASPERQVASVYQWRVSLLDGSLTPHFLGGVKETETLVLDGNLLTISDVDVEECTYHDIAQQAQAQASEGPDEEHSISLSFLTPAVLCRSGLPMPVPDPALVFRHYLDAWDIFAPRELWVNFNLLDAVAFHMAVTEYRLETRRVRLADRGMRVGCLGNVTYTVMGWRKLGVEFLGWLHMLARFSEYCGTGELTTHGLGQTRYGSGRQVKGDRT